MIDKIFDVQIVLSPYKFLQRGYSMLKTSLTTGRLSDVRFKTFVEQRPKARNCELMVNGKRCNKTTREGKPLCNDHIDRGPYVNSLIEKIAQEEEYLNRVARRSTRAVEPESNAMQEVCTVLWIHGARTQQRLGMDLNHCQEIIIAHTNWLKNRNFVYYTKSRRGYIVVTLVKALKELDSVSAVMEVVRGTQTQQEC